MSVNYIDGDKEPEKAKKDNVKGHNHFKEGW